MCQFLGVKNRTPVKPLAEVAAAITAAYRFATRIEVKVNRTNLERIREEADDITEKLVVEEAEEAKPAAPEIETPTTQPAAFTDEEQAAIAAIRAGQPIPHPFPEIIIDAINEKAYDLIGDALINTDCDPPEIYADYAHLEI
jgi:uracil phosphoribosyltransferase